MAVYKGLCGVLGVDERDAGTRLKCLAVEPLSNARLNCIAHPELACQSKYRATCPSLDSSPITWSVYQFFEVLDFWQFNFAFLQFGDHSRITMFIARSEYDRGIKWVDSLPLKNAADGLKHLLARRTSLSGRILSRGYQARFNSDWGTQHCTPRVRNTNRSRSLRLMASSSVSKSVSLLHSSSLPA